MRKMLFIIFIFSINIFSKEIIDKTQKNIKIVSLAPNITDILYYLNLESKIVGVDRFSRKGNGVVVGDFLNVNYEKIIKLAPDYIFLLKSDKKKIERLRKLGLNVVPIAVNRLDDILIYTEKIAKLLNSNKKALPLSPLMGISKLREKKRRVLVIIDRSKKSIDNLYVVGQNSFINDYLPILGLENIIKSSNYPKIGIEKVIKLNPDIIIELTVGTKIDDWNRYSKIKAVKNKMVYQGDKNLTVPSPYLIENLIKFKNRYKIK